MKKNFFFVLPLVIILSPIMASAQTSATPTAEQLQAQLQALVDQLKTLQGAAGLNEQLVAEETSRFIVAFNKNLYFGLKNDADVSNLQEFLKSQEYYAGPISGNYFLLTMEAVKKFQKANNINSTGYFGLKTRTAANKILETIVSGSGYEEKSATETSAQSLPVSSTTTTAPVSTPTIIPSVAATQIMTAASTVSVATTTPVTVSGTTSQTQTSATASSTAIVTLTASPNPVSDGSPTTLSWTSSNVSSCTAGGAWTGSQPTYGSYLTGSLFAATGSYTFTLNCSGSSDSSQSSVTVTVNPPPPTFTVSAPISREQLRMGQTYSIKWTSSSNTGVLSVIRLSLYKGNSYKDFIAVDVPNNGAYDWNIPISLATGDDYQIRIFNLSYPNNYRDSPVFSILASPTSYNSAKASLASIAAAVENISQQIKELIK